jgi:6,7-dimethyl-8-ribityllumazine synthase
MLILLCIVEKGIAIVSLEAGVPVIFGVLTTDIIEQVIESCSKG